MPSRALPGCPGRVPTGKPRGSHMYGPVAQPEERLAVNQDVGGSIPSGPAKREAVAAHAATASLIGIMYCYPVVP